MNEKTLESDAYSMVFDHKQKAFAQNPKGYQYNGDGTPVAEAGVPPPPTVNPSAILPASASPTATEAEQNVINGLTLEKYGVDTSASSGLTLPAELTNRYMPSGNASTLVADLRARGYTVSVDEDDIFAQKGNDYMFVGDGYMQVGNGQNLGTNDALPARSCWIRLAGHDACEASNDVAWRAVA